jgi:hypothetical protein
LRISPASNGKPTSEIDHNKVVSFMSHPFSPSEHIELIIVNHPCVAESSFYLGLQLELSKLALLEIKQPEIIMN